MTVKEKGMDKECSTHGEEDCMSNLGRKVRRRDTTKKDIDVERRIILK
jgi:hypothetical protein